MICVEVAKWGQTLEDLRLASVEAVHARSRERFQALYLIASARFNATTCAAHIGRQDETVLSWVRRYNLHGPDSLVYRRTGGRAPFAPSQVQQLVDIVDNHQLVEQGLSGHLWTLKKLRQWMFQTFGKLVSRNALRRILRQAGLTWKKVKKLLGKANPEKRAAHRKRLHTLYKEMQDGEITLLYVDEAHFHRDLDLGYTWGPKGQRIWRRSSCPKLSERLNCYGAYDFTHGECFLWQDGWCDGERTVRFLEALVRWRAGKRGKLVIIWDNAPCPIAKIVKAKAAELGGGVGVFTGIQPGSESNRTVVGLATGRSNARPLSRQRGGIDQGSARIHPTHQCGSARCGETPLAQV